VDSLKNKIIALFNKIKSSLPRANKAINEAGGIINSCNQRSNAADKRHIFARGLYFFYSSLPRALKKFLNFNKKNSDSGQKQTDFDKKLVFSLSKSRIPSLGQLKYIKRFLSWREFWLINFCFLAIAGSLIFSGAVFYKNHLQIAPVSGGKYCEGLVGAPQYINPIYANISDVDNDMIALVFSSLFKRGNKSELVNDLAESYEISEDNKVYTIKIRDGAHWHNGDELTADDILFTFNIIKDKAYQSTLRAGFVGVEMEKVDDNTIKFILAEPYAAFLELLTFGILPGELWRQIPANTASLAELNLKPIGSGPYKFNSLIKDKQGNIRSYGLTRNEDYYGQMPYIKELSFKFFPSFEGAVSDLNEGLIDGISYLPKQIKGNLAARDSLDYHQLNLPQITAVFFNQEANPALKDKNVRQAMASAIDKNQIISEILGGEARLINSPILPDNFAYNKEIKEYKYNVEAASALLDEAGWKAAELTDEDIAQAREDSSSEDEKIKQQADNKLRVGAGQWREKENDFLIVKLTAVYNEENQKVVEAMRNFWSAISIKTEIELVAASVIQINTIKPRNFQALLYSEVAGADPDPYAFWHSSQMGQSGLNISNYANKDIDALLEDARVISSMEERKEKYAKFQEIIAEEVPAIFLYSPTYTYVQNKKVKGFAVENILIPRDRFSNIADWHVKTGKKFVWN